LNESGCETMALEVGPISGEYLNSLEDDVVPSMLDLNNKYSIVEEDGYFNPPIPFFDYIEDAEFLAEAKKNKWEVIGIDQEYFYSYAFLMDQMYENLSKKEQVKHKDLYQNALDSIQYFYSQEEQSDLNVIFAIEQSETIQECLTKMSACKKNENIVAAFNKSIEIYGLYGRRKWLENNATRILYMKEQLRLGLAKNNFDISKDKLFIKMGSYHLSRGFSPLGLYEVGNTLNELAEYHGNEALTIAFSSRFYMEDGVVKDRLDSENKYFHRYKDLTRIGKEDEWIVIDLRPMIKGHFYHPVRYKFNEHIKDLVQRYDLLIIPIVEVEGTFNFDEK